MRLPSPSAHYSQRVRVGRYVARRLRQARKQPLATSLESATNALKLAGRAWEDSEDSIQDALADRDGADDDLGKLAQTARAALAGRSLDATKTAPYIHIFPDGITYYTRAPSGQLGARYEELLKRLTAHLPAKDPVLVQSQKEIKVGLDAHAKAMSELTRLRTEQSLLSTKLAAETATWNQAVEKIYGTLIAEVGKSSAENFFPQIRVKAVTKPEELSKQPS